MKLSALEIAPRFAENNIGNTEELG